jgi:hypothetical protein
MYAIMVPTNASKYIKISLCTHVGVHCVYELILLYLCTFVFTNVDYIAMNIMKHFFLLILGL